MRAAFIIGAVLAAGCGSHADAVCEDLGYCRGLSSDQVKACQANGKALADEASHSGCAASFDAYFACLDDHYDCQGDTPVFTGCEVQRAALDGCLQENRALNACGALDDALSRCSPPPSQPAPAACAAADACAARCYLDTAGGACAPSRDQLRTYAACAAACPP